jgi:hypothetical protein
VQLLLGIVFEMGRPSLNQLFFFRHNNLLAVVTVIANELFSIATD